MLDSLEG